MDAATIRVLVYAFADMFMPVLILGFAFVGFLLAFIACNVYHTRQDVHTLVVHLSKGSPQQEVLRDARLVMDQLSDAFLRDIERKKEDRYGSKVR